MTGGKKGEVERGIFFGKIFLGVLTRWELGVTMYKSSLWAKWMYVCGGERLLGAYYVGESNVEP